MIVHQFLRWIEGAPSGRRAEAGAALARAYLFSEVEPEVRRGMESALTLLLDDLSPDVRFALADALANSPQAPRHIVLALASDQAETATLILARSPVFLDAELIDIAARGSLATQCAIASRAQISGALAAAIAEIGEPDACCILLQNPGVRMTRGSLRRLAARCGGDPELREAMLARPDLPADVRQSLVREVGKALGNLVCLKQWMEAGRAEQVTREACDKATVDIAAASDGGDLAELAEHLRASGQLNAALLLRSLCTGNLAFFEAAVSVLAKMPEGRVARLVRGGRRGALRAVCRKAGLPMRAFEAFAAAIDSCRELDADDDPRQRAQLEHALAEEVLERYGASGPDAAEDLLALLRRLAGEAARAAAREYAETAIAAA